MEKFIPWGPWLPDTTDYEGTTAHAILNVLPRGDGYGPMPSFASATQALPSACRGACYAIKTDGTVQVFAGTSNKLYRLNNTDGSWTDVSRGAGTYSALVNTAQWQFAQFGTQLIATQANDVVQTYDLTGSGSFSNLGGTPPQAAYVSVVGRFLVLSGLLSNPFRIQWSGLNAITTWTSGVNSSDFQDFPDGGVVRGVAGGEFGTVFQDQSIRRTSFIPGSSLIFQIERVTQDLGLFAPYSIVRAGASIFFRAGQGFYKIDPGGFPTQIGREKVDRTFTLDLDANNLQLFIGASDPRSSRVYWAYKSGAGAAGTYDKILGYDIQLDRFFPISTSGEYLLGISQAGITLEGLDTISASIDALALSLDSYANALQPQIAQFDTNHKQGFFTGPNLEATLESAEQGTAGNVIYTDGFRPITDATTVYGSVSWRETQAQIPTTGSEIAMNSRTGYCNIRREARYIRFKQRIPAGQTWSFAAGFEPTPTLGGTT